MKKIFGKMEGRREEKTEGEKVSIFLMHNIVKLKDKI